MRCCTAVPEDTKMHVLYQYISHSQLLPDRRKQQVWDWQKTTDFRLKWCIAAEISRHIFSMVKMHLLWVYICRHLPREMMSFPWKVFLSCLCPGQRRPCPWTTLSLCSVDGVGSEKRFYSLLSCGWESTCMTHASVSWWLAGQKKKTRAYGRVGRAVKGRAEKKKGLGLNVFASIRVI